MLALKHTTDNHYWQARMKKETIGRNINLLMECFNIKNESQFAKAVNMPQTTINKLISGATGDPRVSTLAPIAEHFKISIDALLSEYPAFVSHAELSDEPRMQVKLVPLITWEELPTLYQNITSLEQHTWPHWYPVLKHTDQDYYALKLSNSALSEPFKKETILIIKKETTLSNNQICLFKHIPSQSVSIRKTLLDNGKYWLINLMSSAIPPAEFTQKEWEMLGIIQTAVTPINPEHF